MQQRRGRLQGSIKIEGITVFAKHGCFDFEKTNEQKFVVSLRLNADFGKAMRSDDLNFTVDYGVVTSIVVDTVKNNSFNLIEKLAYETAISVGKKYPVLDEIEITVSKPDAPIDAEFSNVSFSTTLKKHTAYLSLGSSDGDRSGYLDFATDELKNIGNVVAVSSKYATKPYGGVAVNEFLNSAVKIQTFYNPSELLELLHKIEEKAGRTRDIRWGDRTLDVDIIAYDDLVFETKKLTVPHADYFNREFVLIPLKEIEPSFVCPKTKRSIDEMLSALKN